MRTTHEGEKKTYDKLRTMVLTHIALRQQNKITAQAQNTHNRNTAAAAPGGPRQGDCYKWTKTGNCAAGNGCPFAHEKEKRGSKKKGKGSGKTRSPSRTAEDASARNRTAEDASARKGKGKGKGNGKTRPRSQSRGSLNNGVYTPAFTRDTYRGRSPSGEKNKPICKNWIKGKCSYGDSCKLCHISVCAHWKKGECKAGNSCVFLHRQATGSASPAPQRRGEDSVERRKREKNAAKRKASRERKKAAAAVAVDAETGLPLD